MKQRVRSVALLSLAAAAGLVSASCGKKRPPESPAPQQQTQSRTQVRNDDAPRADAGTDDSAAREEAMRRNRAVLEQRILFAYDDASLSESAQAALRAKLAVLRADPSIRLRIEGHADERGSNEYNLALGLRRARAAVEYLAGFGIDAQRITVQTFGEDRPAAMGHDESSWSQNRRDEFVVTAPMPPSD